MFGYDFVSLTPEQVEARRVLLDQAGFQAYLAPVYLLVAIWTYRKAVVHSLTDTKQTTGKSSIFQRFAWILNTTYIGEFGPLKVQIVGMLYTAFLLYRIFADTGNDYMHVTKAFGHVAISQLPMHYLLSIKYMNSPITLATGLTHERLNAYHRLFGRIVHALLATHAILYLRFFALMNILPKRIQDWDVRLGIMAFWTANFLGLLAIPPIRSKKYHKVFYRSHIILSALLLVVLWFHVPYSRKYVAQAAVIWVANGVLRKGASQTASVRCEFAGDGLVRVKAKVKGSHWYSYLPGVHVYLNQSGLGPRTPWTVLSTKVLSNNETDIELIAKNSGGPMTSALADAAASLEELSYQLEGPYGEAQEYIPELLRAAKVKQGRFLLVAGGVGATYALPIYKALIDAKDTVDGIDLLWLVRNERDVSWANDFFADTRLRSCLRLFITQSEAGRKHAAQKKIPLIGKVAFGRPNLIEAVDDIFVTKTTNLAEDEPLTVMVCGPAGLSHSLRKAMWKHVFNGRDVRWYEERFGFGG